MIMAATPPTSVTPTIVYVLESGTYYESIGGVVSVHLSYAGALKAAGRCMSTAYRRTATVGEPDGTLDAWENGSDFLRVSALAVSE